MRYNKMYLKCHAWHFMFLLAKLIVDKLKYDTSNAGQQYITKKLMIKYSVKINNNNKKNTPYYLRKSNITWMNIIYIYICVLIYT